MHFCVHKGGHAFQKMKLAALFFPWYLVGIVRVGLLMLGNNWGVGCSQNNKPPLSPPPWGRCLFWECIILSCFTPTLSSFWSPTLAQVEEHDPWRELGGGRLVGRANLSMKEGGLFCSYVIHRTGMLQIVFLVSLESSRWAGVHGLGSMMFGLVVQKVLEY